MATKRPSLAFVETRIFTRRIANLGLEGALQELQLMLLNQPDAGDVDPGTGGLRKVRMPDPARGKGKRSGARVHYLWIQSVSIIYLIFVYSKDETETLSPSEKRQLRTIVDAIRSEWASKE